MHDKVNYRPSYQKKRVTFIMNHRLVNLRDGIFMEDKDVNLSIIIPVYNMGDYIKECLDKIIESDLSNYEIIIVNDGSYDNTENEVLKYGDDQRIRYFYQNNSGVSAARNKGIEESIGKWIMFVDADDILDASELHVCMSCSSAINDTYDMICFRTSNMNNYGDLNVKKHEKLNYNIDLEDLIMSSLGLKKNDNMSSFGLAGPWSKLYKKEVIMNKHLRFNTNIKMGEDQIFNLNYFKCIKQISFIDSVVYYIRDNPNSASRGCKDFDFNTYYFDELQALLKGLPDYSRKVYWHAVVGGMLYNFQICICHKSSKHALNEKKKMIRDYYNMYSIDDGKKYVKYSDFGKSRIPIIYFFLNKFWGLSILMGYILAWFSTLKRYTLEGVLVFFGRIPH